MKVKGFALGVIPMGATSTDHDLYMKGLSKSISVGITLLPKGAGLHYKISIKVGLLYFNTPKRPL
jgi:hypothetical protein